MSETLSFPGLGLEFQLPRVAFSIGGFAIYWYGVVIALAFLAGAAYTVRRVKAFGIDPDRLMDLILGGVVLGIVGARLYYVAFNFDLFRGSPASIFNIRMGGIAIYGGIIGAVIAVIILCRVRRVKLLPALDLGFCGVILGQAIGRWGNFFNIEAFGSNTSMPWGMTSPTIQWYLQQHQASLAAIGVSVDPAQPVHPTFFYESIWCLLGFLVLVWYTKRRRFDGELALIYMGWYGLGRFFIEGLRTDSLLIGTIRVSQMLALLCVIASVVVLALIHSRIRREGDPAYLQLYVNTEEGQAVNAGEFYKKKESADGGGDEAPDTAAQAEDAQGQADAGENGDYPADSTEADDTGTTEKTEAEQNGEDH